MPNEQMTATENPFLFQAGEIPEVANPNPMTFMEAEEKLRPWLCEDADLPKWVTSGLLVDMIEAVDCAQAGRPWAYHGTVQYWDRDCYLHRLDGPALIEGTKHSYWIRGQEIVPAEEGIDVLPDGTFATPADQAAFAALDNDDEEPLLGDGTPFHSEQPQLWFYLYGA